MFDLDAYLERIGLTSRPTADLETLRAVQARHVATIPFEDLDPFLGRPVLLDLPHLTDKLVRGRRGGYCFEQNTVLRAALEALGFRVTALAGRVRWNATPGAPLGPRTHMALLVEAAGERWLVDAGFGAHVQDAPLRLVPDVEQTTPAATYRLEEAGGRWSLAAKQGDTFRTAFVFTLDPPEASDFVVANWYTSTHPNVLFTNTLLAELVSPATRVRLVDRRFIERPRGGAPVERTLTDARELADVLERIFRITLPEPAQAIFARITARAGRRASS